jgi:iodotyrosine deiodinase
VVSSRSWGFLSWLRLTEPRLTVTLESSCHNAVLESVGISAGLFIAALHHMGLATLTHTPSPMRFLAKVLGRPESERPFCLFPIGYPADDCVVPDLKRKSLEQVMVRVGN